MIWFDYKYKTLEEVKSNVLHIQDYSFVEYGILIFILILFVILLYYILPYINIRLKYNKDQKEKRKRKNFIRQLALQKDIEDKIEHEID